MIFFVANDGTVINSVPSPVYQGSANANNIYLIAPFAENLQATVAFKLPNGVWTNRYSMTPLLGRLFVLLSHYRPALAACGEVFRRYREIPALYTYIDFG